MNASIDMDLFMSGGVIYTISFFIVPYLLIHTYIHTYIHTFVCSICAASLEPSKRLCGCERSMPYHLYYQPYLLYLLKIRMHMHLYVTLAQATAIAIGQVQAQAQVALIQGSN
jgi:hypothetical protein